MERGYDYLTIGNGEHTSSRENVIARLTGTLKIRTLTLEKTTMWLQIVTDRTGTEIGFQLRLELASSTNGESNFK